MGNDIRKPYTAEILLSMEPYRKKIAVRLLQIGCTVIDTKSVGNGFPDLVVGYKGTNYLLKTMDGDLPICKRIPTTDEMHFQNEWEGQYAIVNNEDAAVQFIVEADIWKNAP